MSIQTELDRLTGAKTTIRAYLEDNGLTVTDDMLIDAMAAMLGSIEAGLVQLGKFTTVTYGSFVPTEDITEHEIDLGYKGKGPLPAVEVFFLIRDLDSTFSGTNTQNSMIADVEIQNVKAATGSSSNIASMGMYYNASSSIARASGIASYNSISDDTVERTVTLKTSIINSSLRLTAGATYSWIAMRRDN